MDPDFSAYQLICPLSDFVVRWGMFTTTDKEKARNWIERADFEPREKLAIVAFLDSLDTANSAEGDLTKWRGAFTDHPPGHTAEGTRATVNGMPVVMREGRWKLANS